MVLQIVLSPTPGLASGFSVARHGVLQDVGFFSSPATDRAAIARAAPVLRALRAQGYTIVSIHTTWFNRVLIRARNRRILREIVVSPSSGDILRDVVVKHYVTPPSSPPGSQRFKSLPDVPAHPDPSTRDDLRLRRVH